MVAGLRSWPKLKFVLEMQRSMNIRPWTFFNLKINTKIDNERQFRGAKRKKEKEMKRKSSTNIAASSDNVAKL